jgi:hypothetical protein
MNDDASEAMIRTREEQWGEADYRQIEKRGWLGHWPAPAPKSNPARCTTHNLMDHGIKEPGMQA